MMIGRKRTIFIFVKKRKFYLDNMIKKFKSRFINILLKFINNKISEIYHINLLRISYKFVSNIRSDFNFELLQTSIGDIFSKEISSKYKNISIDHNKNIIKRLLNEEDEKKKNIFVNLLNKTFLECLDHFRGTKNIKELEGLEKEYNNMINELETRDYDEEYILEFINIIYNYENLFNNKRKRHP